MRTFRSRIFNYKHSMPTPVVVGLHCNLPRTKDDNNAQHLLQAAQTNLINIHLITRNKDKLSSKKIRYYTTNDIKTGNKNQLQYQKQRIFQ